MLFQPLGPVPSGEALESIKQSRAFGFFPVRPMGAAGRGDRLSAEWQAVWDGKASVLWGSEASAWRQGGQSQEWVREGFLEEEREMRSTG